MTTLDKPKAPDLPESLLKVLKGAKLEIYPYLGMEYYAITGEEIERLEIDTQALDKEIRRLGLKTLGGVPGFYLAFRDPTMATETLKALPNPDTQRIAGLREQARKAVEGLVELGEVHQDRAGNILRMLGIDPQA